MLELQVATVVLATGLAALGSLMATHSRQVRKAESWCDQPQGLYVDTHASTWLRLLKPPAELRHTPGPPWEIDVDLPADPAQRHRVEVLEQTLSSDRQSRTALVRHTPGE